MHFAKASPEANREAASAAAAAQAAASQRLPVRAASGVVQRAVGPRVDSETVRALAADPHELYEAARRLADRLEDDALRHAKVLTVLDLPRSRSCQAVASSARDAAARFRAWNWDPPAAQRQADLALWKVVQQKAKALGLEGS